METEVATEQAAEVSVEDRIADKFDLHEKTPEQPQADEPEALEAQDESEGDEATAEADSEETSEQGSDEFVEVEFDGQSYSVPKELKDALMRESDYTKKTTELSQTRKTVELQQREIALANQRQQFDASVSDQVNQLNMLDQYIDHMKKTTDWNSLSAEQVIRQKLEIDQLADQKAELESTLGRAWEEFQANTQAERKKIREEMEAELGKQIPKWGETKSKVEDYVQKLGYPEVAVQNMSMQDYQIAHKAMMYDQLQSSTKSAVKKATDTTGKVIKPTSRKPMPSETQKYLNYRKALKKASNPQEASKIAEQRAGDKMEKLFGL